jgi:LysM repeat protein
MATKNDATQTGNKMSEKDTQKGVMYTFGKKSKPKMNPFFMGVISGFLALLGLVIIIMVVSGGRNPLAAAFATDTPTPTITPLPSFTPTATFEMTATPSATNTPSGPQEYMVKQDDTCWAIAEAFGVQVDVLLAYNGFANGCDIIPGDVIKIPPSDATMPTSTPFPTDFARGSEFLYTVQLGDTLVSIADTFNDDYNQLIARNKITDVNSIQAGDQIKVRYNIMTRTPTIAPTSTMNLVTPVPSATPTK